MTLVRSEIAQPESPDAGRGRRRKSHSHVWRVSECVHELTTAPRSPQVCLIDSHVRFIHLMTHAIQPTHNPRSMAHYKQEKTRRNLNLIWIKILNLIWIKIPHAERHEKVRINVRSPPLRARALPGNKEAAGWRKRTAAPSTHACGPLGRCAYGDRRISSPAAE